ncbi:MAG: hypothetical protein A2V65_10375 [Deltaproteobacteria bacterium RBG_13_49_15]|nr:MAG: hypothetical protein A2V65_10375 [Deltaproteobacteria bacterium RBG_13_49_15]
METFTEVKELVENPHYPDQRRKALADLSDAVIDAPIIDLIHAFNTLAYCFTMQSCYGHFLYDGQKNPHSLDPLPNTDTVAIVEYRIAYICLCVENSDSGKKLLEVLSRVTAIDPDNVQICCAEWFWERQINSFALQVEPERFKHQDRAELNYTEALKIEKIRNEFFVRLEEAVETIKGRLNPHTNP